MDEKKEICICEDEYLDYIAATHGCVCLKYYWYIHFGLPMTMDGKFYCKATKHDCIHKSRQFWSTDENSHMVRIHSGECLAIEHLCRCSLSNYDKYNKMLKIADCCVDVHDCICSVSEINCKGCMINNIKGSE